MSRIRFWSFTLFLLSIFLKSTCFSQGYSYRHFSTNNGLPSDILHDVAIGRNGMIWFCSDDGVAAYNGLEFTYFNEKSGLATPLNFQFYPFRDSILYLLGDEGKVSIIEGYSVKEYPFNNLIQSHNKEKNQPLDFYVDSLQNIHISFSRGKFISISTSGKIEKHDQLESEIMRSKLIDLGADRLFIIHVPASPEWPMIDKIYKHVSYGKCDFILKEESKSNYARSLKLNDSTLLIQNHPNRVAIYSNCEKTDSINSVGEIFRLFMIQDQLILCTMNGAYFYSNLDQTWKLDVVLLKGVPITGLEEDSKGGFWLTTLGKGLYYFPNITVEFENTTNGLPFDDIYSIGVDKQKNVFIGGANGQFFRRNFLGEIRSFNEQNYCGDRITDFSEFEGKMYMLSNSENVISINKEEIDVFSQESNIRPKLLKFVSNVDSLLFSGEGGLYFIKKENISRIHSVNAKYQGVNKAISWNDTIYFGGTRDGLITININSDERQSFSLSNEDDRFSIIDIEKDKFSNYIFSTNKRGVFYLTEDTIYNYRAGDGLLSDVILDSFILDSLIFFGTTSGLSIFKISEEGLSIVKNYNDYNGLSSKIVRSTKFLDGKILVGTSNGLNIINLKDIKAPQIDSNINLLEIYCNNVSLNQKISFVSTGRSNFECRLSSFSFLFGPEVEIRYKIEGYENEWRYQNSNILSFSIFNPGNYRLLVQARFLNYPWNNSILEIPIRILPPFYQTYWFYTLVSGLLLITGYFLFRWRVNILNQRAIAFEKEEKEKAQLELQALRAQMNPHFLFNTLNSIQFYIGSKSPLIGQSYLAKFSKLMRRILDFSTKTQVLLEEEISSLSLYLELEQLRFEGKLEISLDHKGLNLEDNIYIPTMLIQPFIENAIIHGLQKGSKDGKILVKFEVISDELFCFIEDNGVGREESEKIKKESGHKSVGMFVSRRRIEILNKKTSNDGAIKVIDLVDSTGKPTGTKVSICFGKISKLREL